MDPLRIASQPAPPEPPQAPRPKYPHDPPQETWTDYPRWRAVQDIIDSKTFHKSARLRDFLHYVCSRELSGRTAEITEQQIGIHVFERTPGYNASEDNIVRNAARQLRQRLAVYYQDEEPTAALRIEIPKGGYVPLFIPGVRPSLQPVARLLEAVPEAEPTLVRRATPRWANLAWFAAGLTVALLAVWLGPPVAQRTTATGRFWAKLLDDRQPSMLVVGDAGLNMFDNLARDQVTIDSYIFGRFLTSPHAQTPPGYSWTPFARRRYTSVADVRFVEQLLRLPELNRQRFQVRYARDIRIEDLKSNNVILSGAATYDPWVQLFAKDMNFQVDYLGADNTIVVRNRSPRQGEEKQYIWSSADGGYRGYVHIGTTSNLSGSGLVMLVEGTTMAGVDAGIDFLMNRDRFGAFLREKPVAMDHFEAVLEATVVEGNSPAGRLIAYR